MRRSQRALLLSACALSLAAAALLPGVAWAEGAHAPEGNGSSEVFSNSFRYVGGYYVDSADTTGAAGGSGATSRGLNYDEGPTTWERLKNGTYRGTASDGSTRIEVSGATGLGIDVSTWQGEVDWKAVKDSGIVDYAIIRCGWGANRAEQDDDQFLSNVKGCQENGISFGIYLRSYAYDTKTAQDEVDHLLRLLKEAGLSPEDLDYPIYLDLEEQDPKTGLPAGLDEKDEVVLVSNRTLEQIASTFCTAVEEEGYQAGVYANLNWWVNYLQGDVYDRWERWVAQYNPTCDYTGTYTMWQCMSNGSIPGVSGNVDVNFSFSRTHEMHRLYNKWTGEHFYTASDAERDSLTKVGWTYEGTGWVAPDLGEPVLRLYNPFVVGGDHHYTVSENEYEALQELGWRGEGEGWRSASKNNHQSTPVYRQYNPNAETGTHNYTPDKGENDALVKLGWKAEGIAWYAISEK